MKTALNVEKLRLVIDRSNRILITSHIGPDGDSVSSTALLYKTLKLNYPDKTIEASIEEQPYGLDFLKEINEISIKPLTQSLESLQPDLLIILDANSVSRLTRQPESVRRHLADKKVKVAIIDHHEPVGVEKNDLYINQDSPAVTLDVYELFIEKMGFKKPDNYAQIAVTGIYTDTGGFVNRNFNYRKTFEVMPKFIADGADLEVIANSLKTISPRGLIVLKEFIKNIQLEPDYTFSFLSDKTASEKSPENIEAIKQAADFIRSGLLRNVDNRKWGFIITKDVLAPGRIYSVSFRAITDGIDVSLIAARLGGGGHKPAAGAKFEGDNIQDAIAKVQAAIKV